VSIGSAEESDVEWIVRRDSRMVNAACDADYLRITVFVAGGSTRSTECRSKYGVWRCSVKSRGGRTQCLPDCALVSRVHWSSRRTAVRLSKLLRVRYRTDYSAHHQQHSTNYLLNILRQVHITHGS